MPKCPQCGSRRVWKDGLRWTSSGQIQRYLCRECGHRFSENNQFSRKNKISRFPQTGSRQICVSEGEMKNLVKVEPRTETALRESTQDTKGQIISFAWYLKKQGKKQSTIKTYTDYMKILAKKGNINDIESIKLTIAEDFSDRNTKRLLCCVYDNFLKFQGKNWEKPHYKREHKNPFIPTEEELWTAVNTGSKSNFAFSLLLYETGARYNEGQRLEWTDLDPERNKVTIKASKNGKSRTLSISKRLMSILLNLPKTEKQVTVFKRKANGTRQATFRKRMKKLARIQNNPRFLKIHYHTFRHCKALREYHRTKSILHVKKILGHRNIMNTQRYVELYTEIYGDLRPENYICEVAQDTKEAKKLIEQGFEYVTGNYDDGGKLFRKVC